MGPAAAIGLVSYFRALQAAGGDAAILRGAGAGNDPHPADIVRGYLAAATVRLLSFGQAAHWAHAITKETDKDAGRVVLAGIDVPAAAARESAEIVAEVLTTRRMATLGGHSLLEIQDWDDADEAITQQLRAVLSRSVPLPRELSAGVYAAHVVAAAVTAGLRSGAQLPLLFARMLSVLKAMHNQNSSWGPLFVAHPSTISRYPAYAEARGGEAGVA
jgi:hypothetical protein